MTTEMNGSLLDQSQITKDTPQPITIPSLMKISARLMLGRRLEKFSVYGMSILNTMDWRLQRFPHLPETVFDEIIAVWHGHATQYVF